MVLDSVSSLLPRLDHSFCIVSMFHISSRTVDVCHHEGLHPSSIVIAQLDRSCLGDGRCAISLNIFDLCYLSIGPSTSAETPISKLFENANCGGSGDLSGCVLTEHMLHHAVFDNGSITLRSSVSKEWLGVKVHPGGLRKLQHHRCQFGIL